MKKNFIISLLICILTLGALHINASAAAGNYSFRDMVGFLDVLDIMNELSDEKYSSEISRMDFAVIAAKMIGISESESPAEDYFYDIPNDHWGKFSINMLVERGIISVNEQRLFRPNDTITVSEAVVILVRLMNMGYDAELAGGYPRGYMNVANSYDIVSSTVTANNKMTYKDAVTAIYHTLNAKTNRDQKKATLLSRCHDIYYGEGQLSAVCGASINQDTVSDGYISINGVILRTNTEWLYDRLGLHVRYYYYSGDGEDVVVYVSRDNDKKNDIVEITSDCYIGYNNSSVEYYTEPDGGSIRSKKIYPGVTVVRNGKNMSDDLDAAFADFYGYMKLISTDSGREYDVVIIEDYENIEVGYIDNTKKILYDKLNPATLISLSDEENVIVTYQDADGASSAFEKISVGDVVSVARTSGQFAKVIINSTEISGTISDTESTDDSMIITIDGIKYEFDERYFSRTSPSVFGGKVTIKTDFFGKIASYTTINTDGYKYAYIIKVTKDECEERALLKLFTEDGEWITATCAQKVSIDNTKYKTADNIIGALSVGGVVKPQLLRFKCNDENEITVIDTKKVGDSEDELSLHLMENEKNLYKHWTNLVGYNAFVPTTVKVMIVPEEGTEATAGRDQFQIKNISAIPSGTSSRIDLYQIDENSLTIDFVVYYSSKKSSVDLYAALQVVEKVSMGVNGDLEPAMVLWLNSTGTGVKYFVSPNYVGEATGYKNVDVGRLGKGDIVRIATDHKNEITSVDLVLDYSQAKQDGDYKFFDSALNPGYKAVNGVLEVGNFFDGFKMSYGYVARTSGNLIQWGYDKPGDANEIYNVTFDSSKAKILIYDEENRENPCRLGTVNDIIGYYTSSVDFSKLVAVSRSAIITNMVVYK